VRRHYLRWLHGAVTQLIKRRRSQCGSSPHIAVTGRLPRPGRQPNRSSVVAITVVAWWAVLTSTAFAQFTASSVSTVLTTTTTQARVIDWDPSPAGRHHPGAMVVDTQGDDRNRIWFVTRVGGPPHAYETVNRGDSTPLSYGQTVTGTARGWRRRRHSASSADSASRFLHGAMTQFI